MSISQQVIAILADGRFHSGSEIGRVLGVTRAAVWKAVRRLGAEGLELDRVPGRGYRLSRTQLPLDRAWLARGVSERIGRGQGPDIVVVAEADSTNHYVMERMRESPAAACACLAEVQRGGRGRRGRTWIASPYRNIMLSLGWRFDGGPTAANGLSLAAGVAVAQALREFGAEDIGLKWPNDVVWRGRKLAGLLVDVRAEAGGPGVIVLGVGVNVSLTPEDGARVDQPWVDLETIQGPGLDRSRLAVLLIAHLWEMLDRFQREGFGPYRQAWERLHVHAGRLVEVSGSAGAVAGTALGIDEGGALVLRDRGGALRHFTSGEVSLRALP